MRCAFAVQSARGGSHCCARSYCFFEAGDLLRAVVGVEVPTSRGDPLRPAQCLSHAAADALRAESSRAPPQPRGQNCFPTPEPWPMSAHAKRISLGQAHPAGERPCSRHTRSPSTPPHRRSSGGPRAQRQCANSLAKTARKACSAKRSRTHDGATKLPEKMGMGALLRWASVGCGYSGAPGGKTARHPTRKCVREHWICTVRLAFKLSEPWDMAQLRGLSDDFRAGLGRHGPTPRQKRRFPSWVRKTLSNSVA